MKNTSLFRRFLSVALVLAMLGSFLVPVASAEPSKAKQGEELTLTPIDPSELESLKLGQITESEEPIAKEDHALTDVVRVSIALDRPSTLAAGFSPDGIANNPLARIYRASLRADQAAMTAKIEKAIGGKLDVQWNLTLAANFISANVQYGQIDTIKGIEGVKSVFMENRYEPQADEKGDEPNNGAATYMTGANLTWAAGYTGAGSRLAIIDTGIDKEHQSFSGEALEYAFAQTAEALGMSYEDYVASLNLLTPEKIDEVKGQLNASIGSGANAYVSTKIGYGYSYVDKGFDITHENDNQGEHGSHVEGITAANRFVKVDGEFKPALEAVGTLGVAPDAQIVTMKVFGKAGGAYSSDYMVAIEDAIVLGCDSANLSLGSSAPGFGFSDDYESVMNELVENGMVCTISMGNSGMWYDTPKNLEYPYLYADDASFHTGGSPGSYTNSLAIASVDNAGKVGSPLHYGDMTVFYNETSGYGNAPISTLAGKEYEYVLIEGPGVDDNEHVGQEGDAFLALGKEVLEGKVAMCYRGTSSFFAKANAAVAQGAVAVVIINNQPGTINMNLTGYEYTAPAVSITQADGNAIKANSEQVTDEEGNVLYYTGTMSASDGIEVLVPENSDQVTVSSFSSYGVPGTLVMKPEILAPGGSIWSVYGKTPEGGGHDQYEMMSGTSMAAPQVNGMAGVLAQYIRENDLCEKTGLTQRQLINSLLMSTAHPVYDEYGDYWPTIRVGSGLANVADAVAAQSYILMDENASLFPDTAKDGKVKAELGDDPEHNGVYNYSFTVYPLEGKKEFTLRTDIFTQGIAGDGGYGMLQDTGTMLIGANTTYEVNGETYENAYIIEADVNMDGVTDAADAQAILDHVTGEEAEDAPFDEKAADVDKDGKITSYDAKLLLDSATTPTIEITEPTKVNVTIELDSADKELLLARYFTKGFYVEGYTYVDPVADEEGAMDVVHSIPILGFCGSWTDPSMFDRTSAIDDAYGTGKLPYVATTNKINYLTLKDANGNSGIYMGNPYTVEETFPADRLAMNSNDTIASYNYLNIRNLATLGFAVQDESGKVLVAQVSPLLKNGAYYYVNGSTWQNFNPASYTVGKKLSSAGLNEGDKATVGFYALPEYYAQAYAAMNGEVAETGSLSQDAFKAVLEAGMIGDGAAIKYDVTIDNTAPVVKGAFRDLITGDITLMAQDNAYIAYVAVTNRAGTKEFVGVVPEQSEPGEQVEVPLELDGQHLPDQVVLLVGDYAGNEATFVVELGGQGNEDENGGKIFAFTSADAAPGSGNRMLEIDLPNLTYVSSSQEYNGLSVFAPTSFAVEAAEYVDGYVFMAADDGWFYAANLNSMDEVERVGRFDNTTSAIYDMALNYKDNTLYALGSDNTVYSVDLLTGEMNAVAEISINNPKATSASQAQYRNVKGLAIDDAGEFYTMSFGSSTYVYLYKFNLDMVVDGKIENLAPVNPSSTVGLYNMAWGGCMAWDQNSSKLYAIGNYWTSWSGTQAYNAYKDFDNAIYVINTETGMAARANNAGSSTSSAQLYNACSGLFFVPAKNHLIQPTDTATSIEVDPTEMNLLRGQTATAIANVFPWTLRDKSVTWASADESIATVKDGVITGAAVGTTTVTATTVAQPNLTAEITVNVSEAPSTELRGIIWDETGTGVAAVFNTNATNDWENVAKIGQHLSWGAFVEDRIYASTDSNMYVVDADTYEVTALGGIVAQWIPSDAAALPTDLPVAWGLNDGFTVCGLCNSGTYFEVLNPEAGSLNYWDMSSLFSEDPMATLAYIGRMDYTDEEGATHENAAVYYMMTESGKLWKLALSLEGYLYREEYASTGLDLTGVSDVTNETWASMIYDEENEFLYLTMCTGTDDYAYLYAIDANDPSCNAKVGDFNETVWPVVGLYQYEPATDLTLKVDPTEVTMFEGQTKDVKIKVKLGETNEYTVDVADPEIASFEDGVVTGLKEGETTITVTTVDSNAAGEQLSETINVTVKGLTSIEAFVMGQVTDENGMRFAKINLDELSVSKKGAEAPFDVSAGARTGNYYVAGDSTHAVVLDAETFELTTETFADPEGYYGTYPAMDTANYPDFVDEEGVLNEKKALYAVGANYLVTPDLYGWNLSSLGDLAGIAFMGTETGEDGTNYFDYLLMTMTGDLYFIAIDYAGGYISRSLLTNTGITVSDQSAISMAVIQTVGFEEESLVGKEAGLVIANNEDKCLYYFDFDSFETGMFGTLDVDNVSGLVGTFDDLTTVADVEPEPEPDPEPNPDPDPEPNPDPEPEPNPDPEPDPEPSDDTIYATFTFDAESDFADWTNVDADKDSYAWAWDSSIFEGHEGGNIISRSYYSGNALTPDNWAISPAVDLSDATAPAMSVYAKSALGSFPETIAFYAGTSADPEAMTKVSEDIEPAGEWTAYTADLSAFAGESTVYVAIRHYNCSDMYVVQVDDVVVGEAGALPAAMRENVAAEKSYAAPKLNLSKAVKVGDGVASASVAAEAAYTETVEMTKLGQPTNAASGSTNAIKSGLKKVAFRAPKDETTVENGNVTIALSDDVATTNGLFTVTYDPEVLTYVDALSELPYVSIHHEIIKPADVGNEGEEPDPEEPAPEEPDPEEPAKVRGVITVAYASVEEIAAEDVIASLNFTYDETVDLDTVVTVKVLERNDNLAVEEDALDIVLKAAPAVHEHVYGEPEWTWTEDLTSATATFTCECGDVQTVEDNEIDEEVTTEARPHVAGEKTLTASVEFNGETYIDTKTVEIEALPCPCENFEDMPEVGTPEHEAIDWAYTHEPYQITAGMDATHFGTDLIVTRAQAMTFLWAAMDKPEPKATTSMFTDVKVSKWYFKPITWAVENGITAGTGNNKFSPNKTCTHAEMIQFLYATFGKPETNIENPYTNLGKKWYKNAAIWAYEKGIERGENGEFDANAPCTRATTVLYIYRALTGQGLPELPEE